MNRKQHGKRALDLGLLALDVRLLCALVFADKLAIEGDQQTVKLLAKKLSIYSKTHITSKD